MKFPLIKVEDFCRTGSGATPARDNPDYYGGNIPWIKSGELRETLITNSEEFVTEHALQRTALKLIPPGAILIAMYGATVGRVGLLGIEATTNQAVCHIVPDANIADTRYLYHFMQSHAAEFVRRGVGGAQPNISQGMVRETLVPLPPLEEQKRIAAILDQADALRRLRARALTRLNALGQAIFHEMFGDMVTNSKQWAEGATLGEVADIVSGVTKGRKTNDTPTRSVPYMAVSNVQDQRLKMDAVKVIDATEDEISRFRLQKGDLLLTEGGDPDKLGRGSLWADELPECIHQNHVFRVRVTSTQLRPLFLNWLVGSQRGKQYFLRSAKQTTGIASINKSQLKEFPLLLPPVALQMQFENRLASLARTSKATSDAALTESALFTSLQHRAFRGEL